VLRPGCSSRHLPRRRVGSDGHVGAGARLEERGQRRRRLERKQPGWRNKAGTGAVLNPQQLREGRRHVWHPMGSERSLFSVRVGAGVAGGLLQKPLSGHAATAGSGLALPSLRSVLCHRCGDMQSPAGRTPRWPRGASVPTSAGLGL